MYLYTVLSLALFAYVVYNYGRLDDMSNRESGVYGAALALAAIFFLMPFSKLIKIGYIAIVPYLWHVNGKAEQAQKTADEALAKATEALNVAMLAQLTAENNATKYRPMTEQEVETIINSVFYPEKTRRS